MTPSLALRGSLPASLHSLRGWLPALLLATFPVAASAQQPMQAPTQQNVRKQHLEYCVQNLSVKVSQAEAIKGVMQQPLLPYQKLEALGQILTAQQKQQLRACMQQPMPQQSRGMW